MTRYPTSLDDFHQCPVSGCEWQIHPSATRCYLHRGPALAQYRDGPDGEITVKFMPRELDPDYEPDPAA